MIRHSHNHARKNRLARDSGAISSCSIQKMPDLGFGTYFLERLEDFWVFRLQPSIHRNILGGILAQKDQCVPDVVSLIDGGGELLDHLPFGFLADTLRCFDKKYRHVHSPLRDKFPMAWHVRIDNKWTCWYTSMPDQRSVAPGVLARRNRDGCRAPLLIEKGATEIKYKLRRREKRAKEHSEAEIVPVSTIGEAMKARFVRGAETRLRIIRTAADLFHKQGVRATSPDQIIEASRTGKGQFYQYFRSKEGLIHEVLQTHLDAIRSGTANINYEISSWKDLEKWFLAQIDLQKSFAMTRGCPFGTMGNEVTENDELTRQDLSLIFEVV